MMPLDLTLHAGPLEIVWLVVSFAGWTVKLFLLAMARENYVHHKTGTPIQIYMSKSIYTHMKLMFTAFCIALGASVYGIFHVPPPPPLVETQSFGTVLCFIALVCVLTVHAILVARWWHRLGLGAWNGETHNPGLQLPVTVTTQITPTNIKTEVKERDKEAT